MFDDFNNRIFDHLFSLDKYWEPFQNNFRDRSVYWKKNETDKQIVTFTCVGLNTEDITVEYGFDEETQQAFISTEGEKKDDMTGNNFSANYKIYIDKTKIDHIDYQVKNGLLSFILWYKKHNNDENIPIREIG